MFKKITKGFRVVSVLLFLLITGCAQVQFYPAKTDSAVNQMGLTSTRFYRNRLTSVGENSYVAIVPVAMNNRTMKVVLEAGLRMEDKNFLSFTANNVEVEYVNEKGQKKKCVVNPSQKYSGFTKYRNHANGEIYVISPKVLRSAKYFAFKVNVDGEKHTLHYTPKSSEAISDYASITIPDFSKPKMQLKKPKLMPKPVEIEPVRTAQQEQVIQSKAKVNELASNIRSTIQDEFSKYMENLRATQTLSENTQADVTANMVEEINAEGKKEYNLNVKYEYAISKDVLNEKVLNIDKATDDFPAGAFKLSTSKAARVTVTMLKTTIEEQLKNYLLPGRKVTIKISGSTDSSPIRNAIAYDGSFGEINEAPCFVNGIYDNISVSTKSGIQTNEQLAFLRTHAVREFIENNVGPLRITENKYEQYANVLPGLGADKRRVAVEIVVHDAFENQYPELSSKNSTPISAIRCEVDTLIPETNMINENGVAVVIGNCRYAHLNHVAYAINDANTMKEYLTKTLGFKAENIIFATDANSLKLREIFGSAENHKGEVFKRVIENKSDVFVFYSGHGNKTIDGGDAYLIPVDAEDNQKDMAGYRLETLYDNLSKLKAKSVTVVLDACFSGKGFTTKTSASAGIKMKPVAPEKAAQFIILSATQENEQASWFEEKGHSMFTYFFLRGLQQSSGADKDGNGKLTYRELYDYLADPEKGVPYYSKRYGTIQHTPSVQGNMQDNVFVTYE